MDKLKNLELTKTTREQEIDLKIEYNFKLQYLLEQCKFFYLFSLYFIENWKNK